MKRVVKTMSIVMLMLFMGIPCYAGKIPLFRVGIIRTPQPIQIPVEAEIGEDTYILTVNFLEDIGNVDVEVRDGYGYTISSETVATGEGHEFSVQLAGVIVGDYQLLIIEKDNSGYIGDFELY